MKKTDYMRSFNENGISVFLLRPLSDDQNSEVRGKIPMFKGWQQTGIHDDETIENFCDIAECTGAGYGVLCRNLLVIDVDARNGGVESFNKLYDKFPQIGGAGLIVETGSGEGSKHYYFKLDPEIRVSSHLKEYPGIDFKHSGLVVGPGSMHRSGRVYSVLSGDVESIEGVPEGILSLLKPQEYERVNHGGENFIVDDEVLKNALEYVYCYDDYHEWINIGMAIHKATNGDGVAIWDEWSSRGKDYNERDIHYKWGGFGKAKGREITAGTIFKIASDNGWVRNQDDFIDMSIVPEAWLSWGHSKEQAAEEWVQPVEADDETGIDTEYAKLENCPVPLDDIDLTDPPGFVGEVAKWIDSQCFYPRKYLSAVGAIYAVSTVAGLRYMGGNSRNTRTNMFILGVADSATGKDAVVTAVREIISASGMGQTVYGGIKSDKEVTVNLISHQSANYVVDEIGEKLRKVNNSKNSGASHLDGVIATFMEVYSKSGKSHVVTGDMQREIQKTIRDQLSHHQERIENNEDPTGLSERAIVSLKRRLEHNGTIEKPFLSMMGFTTPGQMKDIASLELVQSGFLGRALLCIEDNEYPSERFGHTPPALGMGMKMKLMTMAHSGNSEAFSDRVEWNGEMVPVPYTSEADRLLNEFSRWQNNYGRHRSANMNDPFGALYRRMAEKAQKIALTLALDDGCVTEEHVKWGVAASWMDAQAKIELVNQYDKELSKKDNLKDKILKEVLRKPGRSLAVIRSVRCLRDYEKAKVEEAMDQLVKAGLVKVKESKYFKG